MSGETRHARLSRLDPVNWPPGMGIALFVVWLAFAVASTLWIHVLLWTVLPVGLALFLLVERYPGRVIGFAVLPLTVVTVMSQLVAASPDAPTWAAFAIYLVGCGYFSLVVCSPNRDRVVADLPRWVLGEPFAARLAWARFEESVIATNSAVRKINAGGRESAGRGAIERLAADARRESSRGGIWHDAWAAHAAWLDGLAEFAGTESTPDALGHVNDLLAESNRVQAIAMEQTDQLREPISD